MTVRVDDELEALVAIARRAAVRVAEIYEEHCQRGVEVELKGPGDPVTVADREANDIICEALADAFPDSGVIAEESAPEDAATLAAIAARPRVFFVDPLDGTREFVDQNGEFAVMIGLAVGGRAEAGVIAMPVDGRVVAGRREVGVFVQEPAGSRRALQVTPTSRFDDATMVVSRSHRPPLIEPLRRRLGIGKLQPCGSVGVKIARIVLGDADLYVHAGPGMKHWDTCGPQAILEAAGGR
ncbi:MAG TPA: 3'(2'),5'-bisphosphate nucleotidase CysQ, partial [Polyangiaceae bacterium]|nr:3'(2'),5'-bisphosphate nucleotidase CysQ [Polyangiaceae bacterium]